jgi:hypothetical protein
MKVIVRVTRKESVFESETPVEVQSGHFEVGPLLQGTVISILVCITWKL